MSNSLVFSPNWASPPGDTIVSILEERDLSLESFFSQLGYSREYSKKLISGLVEIDQEIASDLSRTLGASKIFWLTRESQYRNDIARLKKSQSRLSLEGWLRELPLREMIQFGWIEDLKKLPDKAKTCLDFFDVPDIQAWSRKYASYHVSASFRTSSSFESKDLSVIAWLRQGERTAQAISCKSWNEANFRNSLSQIRLLTRERNPAVFVPKLQSICAESGVAVSIVRAPTGCRASGATKFLSEEKALLLLSCRYLSDDHFWFTFFHEAAHLILHGKDMLFVEGNSAVSSVEEQEANDYSEKTLIPEAFREELFATKADARSIIRLARKIGVSPGVLVGQLQHHRLLQPSQMNHLKVRYSWL
ncbi:ImmA/IrrE family metallo-endopeptidase [Azospira sp. I13]|uniref:ImmA/IrrE family metallo-endopeptidase n=1 Tax=Azospira sp. I13 TaxID=1765050 RepID=UPI000D59DA0D|nr:ImmA/IrrE family metallo-endopeptidase [Azospira sp. I13]